MNCSLTGICGGCKYRNLGESEYRQLKQQNFDRVLSGLKADGYRLNPPVFIADGSRRRAQLAFEYRKKHLVLGFNREASHQITDAESCRLLTPMLNRTLPLIRRMTEQICAEPCRVKKGKKFQEQMITSGDVFICEADNGIDVVLEYDAPLELAHRMIVAEIGNELPEIIRISHRRSLNDETETLFEKTRPVVRIGKYDVEIPAGTFLQPSKAGQQVLGDLVMKYLSGIKGRIADLFCGVGTFSYSLCALPDVKVTAADSSEALLKGFGKSVKHNMITNIEIVRKNLFKYPLTADEFGQFSAVVFDPPRAGAAACCRELAKAEVKPETVVAVSCNPATFVNDANILTDGGYRLEEVTMVDQFCYSNHSELVACFTNGRM